MGHDGTSRKGLRPKPNEGYAIDALSLQLEEHELFKNALNTGVDRPVRKADFLPIPQVYSLEVLSNGNGEKRPHRIVSLFKDGTRAASFPIAIRACIAFVAEVGGDFRRVEGEPECPPLDCNVL